MSEQEGVAAVDRALAILDALTTDRTSLAEIARRTGLYKSTILRLLKSLEKSGYALRTADGNYRLGSKVLSLGATYQRFFRTADIVPHVLEQVAADIHEGASYYICEEDQRVCLHRVDSTRAIRDSVQIGDRLPLTVGAAGHVLRAFSGARGVQFDDIRRSMYAASYGERDAETAALAAPVFGPGNKLMGALSVSGPRYRLEATGEDNIVPVLYKYAKLLTQTFGGNVDDPSLAGWNQVAQAGKGSPAVAPAKARAKPAAKAATKPTVKPSTGTTAAR